MLKSIGAVGAGFVLVVALSLGTDVILHATGVFPGWGRPMADELFLLATLYRTVYGIAGSYLTARLAPSRPMRHALVGGAIGMVIATVGAVATWNRGPELGPHWYPVSLVALALPQAWAGAKLRERQVSKAE
jgi:hypothetical protein